MVIILFVGLMIYAITHNEVLLNWNVIKHVSMGVFIILFIILLILTLINKSDPTIFYDEFILYDNGWFVFWLGEPQGIWIGPAKLDWILPESKPYKELKEEVGYKPHRWYCMNFQQYCYAKEKENGYLVFFKLPWSFPSDKWKDWVFFGAVSGMLDYTEYIEFLGMVTQLKIKAKENIDKGIIKIPHYNFCQENTEVPPEYWNYVFREENIRELYKKETGEDIPEPVRSFLFDYKKFKNVYLKNKRETGDWFGRKNKDETIS